MNCVPLIIVCQKFVCRLHDKKSRVFMFKILGIFLYLHQVYSFEMPLSISLLLLLQVRYSLQFPVQSLLQGEVCSEVSNRFVVFHYSGGNGSAVGGGGGH